MNWLTRVASIAMACAVCAAGESPRREPPRNPVVVVGLDGLEWNVVLPMLRAGRLPTLAGLMRRGVFGELRTAEKTVSPAIWASVVTGVTPAEHGIDGFLCDSSLARGGKKRLCTSADRNVKALWDILGERGLTTHVVGWWQTYPVEPIEGVMVAQTNTQLKRASGNDQPKKGSIYAGIEGQVHPPKRTKAVFAAVREVEETLDPTLRRIFGAAADSSDPNTRGLWRECIWSFRADAVYRRVALELLRERNDPDLFLVYFGGTDVVGHRFWRYYDPEAFADPAPPELLETLGGIIPDYYQEMDRVLGEILDAAPASANVLVLSDHGMHPVRVQPRNGAYEGARAFRSGGHGDAPSGVLIAAGPDIRTPSYPVKPEQLVRKALPDAGSILDITPTILTLLGLPVGRDMDGRVLTKLFATPPSIAWVDSYTPFDWYSNRSRPAPREDPADDAERMEQLRALGYLD